MMEATASDKKRTARKAISPQEYNKILNRLELENIRMVCVECKSEPLELKSQLSVRMDYGAVLKNVSDKNVSIIARYTFEALAGEDEKRVARIHAEYDVRLRSQEEFSKDFFQVYKDMSLPVNVWPFFREFVHTMLVRMGYPPFDLPFLVRTSTRAEAKS